MFGRNAEALKPLFGVFLPKGYSPFRFFLKLNAFGFYALFIFLLAGSAGALLIMPETLLWFTDRQGRR